MRCRDFTRPAYIWEFAVNVYSQRYSRRCENAGRDSILEFSSIKSKKDLNFLLFLLENSKVLPLPAFWQR